MKFESQGHVFCSLLLDGPVIHLFPWQPLEGIRRVSINRLVRLGNIIWVLLALLGICHLAASVLAFPAAIFFDDK